MKTNLLTLGVLVLIAVLAIGCGTTPTATPMPTQPPVQVTVIVTATLPPPTATSPLPSLTAIPTVALTATLATATPATIAQATKAPTSSAPKATATKKPGTVVPVVTATATALPIKYGAPTMNKPIWTDSQKDEVVFDGGAIVFNWQSMGGLQGDECYLIQARTEALNGTFAERSDYWLVNCGNQAPLGASVTFTLESPKRGSPNYDSIKNGADQMWAHWSLTVVKKLGSCDASGFKCKYAPVSPTSTNYFLLKGS